MRIVPRPCVGGKPLRRADQIEHVAEQYQVDRLDRPKASAGAEGCGQGQFVQLVGKQLHRRRGKRRPKRAVGEKQIASDHEASGGFPANNRSAPLLRPIGCYRPRLVAE